MWYTESNGIYTIWTIKLQIIIIIILIHLVKYIECNIKYETS